MFKDSTTKYVEILCKCHKVEGYKVNIQDFIIFLKIDNKHLENVLPFATAPKYINCTGLNLNQNVQV